MLIRKSYYTPTTPYLVHIAEESTGVWLRVDEEGVTVGDFRVPIDHPDAVLVAEYMRAWALRGDVYEEALPPHLEAACLRLFLRDYPERPRASGYWPAAQRAELAAQDLREEVRRETERW
jgi:hypothetical protein